MSERDSDRVLAADDGTVVVLSMDVNLLIEIFRVVNATAFCGLVTLQCNVLRGRMTFVRPSTNHLITTSSQAPLWNTKCTTMSCQSFYVTLIVLDC